MKTAESANHEMSAEYQRDDLGPIVRGKYAARYTEATNIVVIDPALTKAFPNAEAVNNALRGLLEIATNASGREKRTRTKRALNT